MWPPLCLTIPSEVARPRPVPSLGPLVVKKGSKILRWVSGVIPTPGVADGQHHAGTGADVRTFGRVGLVEHDVGGLDRELAARAAWRPGR